MLALGAAYFGFLAIVAIATIGMTHASGEVLPRFGADAGHDMRHTTPRSALKSKGGARAWFHQRQRRQQFLALIITDRAEAVAKRIMDDLHRGVTSMSGKGMYTGKDRSILLCALTVTEVYSLKSAVSQEDPQAFVVVSPAQEILGRGFVPLGNE
jgi:hypothetical protein